MKFDDFEYQVKTWKMHLFTIIQFGGLGILWGVKESPAALSFPFFVISMLGLRWSLKFLFTEKELEHVSIVSNLSLSEILYKTPLYFLSY